MTEAFSNMLWPLMACLILVGIHAYLGIHVIARKVIFVDLALAQIAALGAVYGVFLGLSFETDAWCIKGVSVLFTLLGAVVFSFTRTDDERIPHEAIIGIIYAATLSMTILVTANLPHGADEVRQMLAGNILWVTKEEVLFTAVLYGVIGAIHMFFRKQFFQLSQERAHRDDADLNVKLWDFLFYATFGVVVTSSVGMGGVLLVFGYLVIPSVIGVMLAHDTKWRLIIGWTCGAVMSVVGVIVSYFLDLPSGPTIVVGLGVLLLIIVLIQELAQGATRRRGFIHAVSICATVIIVVLGPFVLNLAPHDDVARKSLLHSITHSDGAADTVKAALSSHDDEAVMEALKAVKEQGLRDLTLDVVPLLSSLSDKKRELAVKVLASLSDVRAKAYLEKAVRVERDAFIKIEMAETLAILGDTSGIMILAGIAASHQSEFAKDDAFEHLKKRVIGMPSESHEAFRWLKEHSESLVFDDAKKAFFLNR